MTENPQPPRPPGAWPIEPVNLDALEPADQGEQYARRQQERALHELVLDSIRHDLQQQPGPASIRAATRRWITAVTQLADELINTRRTDR
ncbi:hypothetical protein [Streptomyces shenzhenensis]|uniref:hypothetical protein n=1 Tax=Streptomyces shenzhenensis TaxID=943815 RepID=UPI0036BBB697